jgi:hypothetical protein
MTRPGNIWNEFNQQLVLSEKKRARVYPVI